MFVKIKYKRQVYLIGSKRLSSIQQLVEIAEKYFEKLPKMYTFTYKDEDDDDIIMENQQNINTFLKQLTNLDEIYIQQCQRSIQMEKIITSIRQKIKKQQSKKVQKNILNIRKNRPEDHQKKVQAHNLSLNKIHSQKHQQRNRRKVLQDINQVGKEDQQVYLNKILYLQTFLQISNEQAVNILKKYPNQDIQQIINRQIQQQS